MSASNSRLPGETTRIEYSRDLFPAENTVVDRNFVNETHPKVLYYACTRKAHNFEADRERMVGWLCNYLKSSTNTPIKTEHEWDALISAWATMKAVQGEWTHDLMRPNGDALAGLLTPIPDTTYYWPESLTSECKSE